ncbi:aldehyde dehydrogenase family protein [Sphingomonas sp. KC8]|uniref:aldehyde dehydrogenase family protein n=1 Tax=Sphingomonas sp. KC8 TaxID=1030157 RepID=UPI000248863A|nr:aldehyde dehydrogenase family protein [Sphingomonas sp. KC8]ARS27905.1 aldehyde dehydrogenase [Sphingomonas sp. KC8]
MLMPPNAKPSLLIGGVWRGADASMAVENPYNGAVIAHVACATEADVADAIASGLRGQRDMARLSTGARAAILHRAADALAADGARFAAMITAETGKTIRAATKEAARAVNTLRLSAEEATRLNGETIAFDSFAGGEQRSGFYAYEPVGLIAAITPFNDPLNLACHKLGPAFAAGNAVVLKPADQAPLTAIMLAELLLDAGLPPEALNLLTGYGRDFGGALVGSDDVAMVSFTGGARVGAEIARTAGIKRIGMELGANSPVIVAADADLEKAAAACVSGAFWAAGQNCIGVQRIFVHRAIYAAFRDLMVAAAAALVVGDPMLPETDIGPMIGRSEAERMARWTAEAVAAGAALCTGGHREGAVFHPTIFEQVPGDARIVADEAFGPVVSLFVYDDLDDAIAAANEAPYAIHAAIFTASINDAHHAARALQAAGVMINDSTDYRLDAMPFGGARRGNMGREGVRFAIREMSQTKVVCFNHG